MNCANVCSRAHNQKQLNRPEVRILMRTEARWGQLKLRWVHPNCIEVSPEISLVLIPFAFRLGRRPCFRDHEVEPIAGFDRTLNVRVRMISTGQSLDLVQVQCMKPKRPLDNLNTSWRPLRNGEVVSDHAGSAV